MVKICSEEYPDNSKYSSYFPALTLIPSSVCKNCSDFLGKNDEIYFFDIMGELYRTQTQ